MGLWGWSRKKEQDFNEILLEHGANGVRKSEKLSPPNIGLTRFPNRWQKHRGRQR